jgi:hypothetical protein
LIDDRVPAYNFDIAEGVTYELDITKPFGQRIQNLRFQGKPLDSNQKVLVIPPIIGVLTGVVAGLFAWVAAKLFNKKVEGS